MPVANVEIKTVGDEIFEIYINGRYEQDCIGADTLMKVLQEIFIPKKQECLNIPKELLVSSEVGKVSSWWDKKIKAN